MIIGAKVPNSGVYPSELGIGTMAKLLEDAGFESLWVSDHIVMPHQTSSRYPFSEDGRPNWPMTEPYYDAIVALSVMAAATQKAKLGTAVMVIPLRNPVMLAKQVASIDVISGGRMVFGVGSGWLEEEFKALYADFKNRGKVLKEWINILRLCWQGTVEEFRGEFYAIQQGIYCLPTPVHPIDILIGGHSMSAYRHVVRHGNGWLAHQSARNLDTDALESGVEAIKRLALEAGKDPGQYRMVLRIIESATRVDDVRLKLKDIKKAGIEEIIVDVDWEHPETLHDTYTALKEVAE